MGTNKVNFVILILTHDKAKGDVLRSIAPKEFVKS